MSSSRGAGGGVIKSSTVVAAATGTIASQTTKSTIINSMTRKRSTVIGGIAARSNPPISCSPYTILFILLILNFIWFYIQIRHVTMVMWKTNNNSNSSSTSNSQYQQLLSPPQRLNRFSMACKHMKSIQDLKQCYPPELVREMPKGCIDTKIQTWEDIQHCIMGHYLPQMNITNIAIIGERNSGTKFIAQSIQQCFHSLSNTIKIHRDFIRGKHFFQPAFQYQDVRNTLLIVIVRNPYDWMEAMRLSPYHALEHIQGFQYDYKTHQDTIIPYPWKEFVSIPWATHRSKTDQQVINQIVQNQKILQQQTNNHHKHKNSKMNKIKDNNKKLIVDPNQLIQCVYHFPFQQVVPCQYDNESYRSIPKSLLRGYEPFYELHIDGSGKPYDHLLQLRRDKLYNFMIQTSMTMSLNGFLIVRYEDILRNGTEYLFQQIATMLQLSSIPSTCEIIPPQPERINHRPIAMEYKQWIYEHMDPYMERVLGYYVKPT